jgi:serine protease SohB
MLDPFRPERAEDVERLDRWLSQLHDVFVAQVRARRGPRLKDDPDLFTGEVWIGEHAVGVGLADGIGHLVPTMKARFGDKVRFRRHAQRRPFLSRLSLSLAEEATGLIEERAAFARWGL